MATAPRPPQPGDHRPAALFVMGPTAAGKTDLAIALAARFPFEIISVDSAMVYRQMDIGTAKPDAATLARAPHHLIDICDPAETYSAARFVDDALKLMAEITQRQRIPLLVGGTGLYFRSLEQGLSPLPAADPAIRARLEQERAALGTMPLHQRLARVDPTAAARIHPNDPQRLIRALEVFEITGKTVTELYRHPPPQSLQYRTCKIALMPCNRAILHQRIETRFQTMLERGFIAEVKALKDRGDLTLDHTSMRAVGYRQVWNFLAGEIDYQQMMQRGIVATRQFAKRQLTWLRAEPDIFWLNSLEKEWLDCAIDHLSKAHVLSA